MDAIVQTGVDIGIRINRIPTEGNTAVTTENTIIRMKDKAAFLLKNKLTSISRILEENTNDKCKADDGVFRLCSQNGTECVYT